MFESLPESRKIGNGWKITWEFIVSEATDDNDLDLVIMRFFACTGTHNMDKEEENNLNGLTYVPWNLNTWILLELLNS